MSSSVAHGEHAQLYNETEFCNAVHNWWSSVIDEDDAVQVKLVTPKHPNAVFACDVQWRDDNTNMSALDLTAVTQSLRRVHGPLFRVSQYNAHDRKMHVCLLPMPISAWSQLNQIVHKTASIVATDYKYPLYFFVVFFALALLNLLVPLIKLHNHWYAYDEPWQNSLQFILFHVRYYFGYVFGFTEEPHTH